MVADDSSASVRATYEDANLAFEDIIRGVPSDESLFFVDSFERQPPLVRRAIVEELLLGKLPADDEFDALEQSLVAAVPVPDWIAVDGAIHRITRGLDGLEKFLFVRWLENIPDRALVGFYRKITALAKARKLLPYDMRDSDL